MLTSSRAGAAAPEQALDEVRLRDGRELRGRIVSKEPGRWVVIETEDGVRRTLAWDRVEEVAVGPNLRQSSANTTETVRGAWLTRSGGGMSYELRVALTGIVLPSRTFGLTGTCATGTGVTPVTIYGQTASDNGRAAGGGLGGRIAYMYLSRLDPDGASSWWALRVASGLDLEVLHARLPTGLRTTSGELCSTVAKRTHEVETKSSAALLAHVPFHFGAHLGLGRFDEPTVWRGVVVGAAWSPSYLQLWPWNGAHNSGHFNPLGIELTVDFVTLRAQATRRSPESNFRVSLFFAPSVDDTQPMIGTLAFGPAWY